ncbi:uncharacterized protein LOC130591341 [Beta vulgaris subsp. vulgaris]|uniref:uncharacterized protein LOC130591341 n=1 Tax=Beta vulgaris subsp. vulgaris TaxID=3555 RepID=UPI002546D116|nr:uncharacterized protein LOC130591341 [Beta vulgaris subsp. vulgaris]
MDEEDFEAFVVFAGIGEEFCMDEEELLLLEGLLGQNSAHDMSVEELLSLEQQMRDDDDEDDAVWYFSDSNSDNEEHDNTEIISEEENNISTKKPNLPNNLRRQLVLDLFSAASAELVLPRGMVTHVVLQYAISRFTVNRIWGEAKRQKLAGLEVNVSSKKTNSGRKPLITDEEALRAVPLKQRTTMRSFATALEVSPSTIYRLLKKGILRSHTNSIKPKLTPKHKTDRLKFILSHIIPPTVTSKPRFDCLYNMVHIDEKWFFMSRITQRFYLLSDEEDPYRACQSKNFITKVMFEAAIARPIITPNGEVIWDGKIGIFPFVDYIPAQRNSSNRPAGTIETKAKQSIIRKPSGN